MAEFFSSDGSYLLQILVLFPIVLLLLLGGWWLLGRLAGRGLSVSARAAKTGRQPRLGIVDIYELDRQRQLILLRRDNVEHLLLVGGPNDVVVERNVQRGARLPSEGLLRPDLAEDEAGRPLGGPDEEQAPQPPASPPPFAPTLAPPFAPTFEMPVVVPPPLPGSRSPAPVQARSLDPRLFETEGEAPGPARARASRLLRRTPPPLVEPRPEPASERPAGVPPVMASGEPRPVDPAVLSDMAHQLEVALRRPSSAVTPPPSQAPTQAPGQAPNLAPGPVTNRVPGDAPGPAEAAPQPPTEPAEPPARVADPVAAGMAAAQVLSPALPAGGPQVQAAHQAAPREAAAGPAAPAARSPAPPDRPPAAEAGPEAEAKPEAAPARAAPPPKAAPPTAEKPRDGAEPPTKDAAEAKPQPSPAPFSVEEIEAEFARLLGRPIDKKS